MHYGGDYNPEQWTEEIWHEDVARMREAGVTMVSLGIFAWSRLQPAEGEFDFAWLDRVIDLLHEGGIAVDLATATASPPPWMHERYPEILPVTAEGVTLGPGSRQHYAPSSPVYRRLAAELVTALVERYADHPAIVMWHVNNEYGCHLHADYSDNARDAFRAWLRERYGSVDALNDAWGTAFWSQRYTSFDQVLPPRAAPYSHNPGQLLDFRRFTSDMLLECYLMEKEIIRAAGATQPITTNFMGAFKPANYQEWAEHMDVITDDAYPDPDDPESFRDAAFQRDLMRSLKPGTPWLLMEQVTGALNWRPTNAPKAPQQMAALSMQCVGRGADGVLFFQWRQSRAGAEKFHAAMLPHAGTGTRIWREVTELGAQLGSLPELPSGGADARVALVMDWESWWAVESPDHPSNVLDYVAVLQRWYRALHRRHVMVDIVPPERVTADAYDLAIAPALYLLRAGGAEALSTFVAGGGHLLAGPFTDVVDERDAFLDGGFLTRLGPALGVTIEDFGALAQPGGTGQSEAPLAGPFGTVAGTLLAEEVVLRGATPVATFAGGRRDGDPALTEHAHGEGTGWYLATVPDEQGADALAGWALDRAGIAPVLEGLPVGVEAAQRGSVVTVINHGSEPAVVDVAGRDLLRGEPVTEVHLDAFGYALVDTAASDTATPDAAR
ncbi:beta-galactosidase [Demequina sp. NBRC 110056]|uniref:beta-galactosidase n=1 Tax=Demequina sp. NBRC 110056 TaxID=1570345 RepID=UPI000A067DEC|nr:beta-galactosidase [Demequina sp. NBRC 110056]